MGAGWTRSVDQRALVCPLFLRETHGPPSPPKRKEKESRSCQSMGTHMPRRTDSSPIHTQTVCIAVLEKVDGMLEGKAKKDKLKIEGAIDSFCGKKDLSQQDKKLVRESQIRVVCRGLWLSG